MKGIILAGGAGTRLHPITVVTSKQLLPIYDKPMIYYPLSTLMSEGVRDILIITTPRDQEAFIELLGDGSQWGINLCYEVQSEPRGLPEAFVIGKTFIGASDVMLILGDNLFFDGNGKGVLGRNSTVYGEKAVAGIYVYQVSDPERYGVVRYDSDGLILEIEEKPSVPDSNWAVTGVYRFESGVCDVASSLRPSARGELEIVDLCNYYLKTNQLDAQKLGPAVTWLDTGTNDSLLDASKFVSTVQARSGALIGSPDETAYRNGWISAEDLLRATSRVAKSNYGVLLSRLLNRG
jgi:glucose-1-phosphate thymidylyltransferase